jgi:hypothetical protein
MLDGGQPEKPAILVLSAGDGPVENAVLAGIEEEGVPSLVEHPAGDDDARALARRAANRSSLSVGVGIDARGQVCVQHEKLPEPPPALFTEGLTDVETARTLGHNAARMVVGIPLRTELLS